MSWMSCSWTDTVFISMPISISHNFTVMSALTLSTTKNDKNVGGRSHSNNLEQMYSPRGRDLRQLEKTRSNHNYYNGESTFGRGKGRDKFLYFCRVPFRPLSRIRFGKEKIIGNKEVHSGSMIQPQEIIRARIEGWSISSDKWLLQHFTNKRKITL